MSDDLIIAPAREKDLGLVYDAWLDAFYDAHASGPMPSDVYRAAYRETIRRILTMTPALVARSPRDENLLYGFVCATAAPPVLYFLYVKQPYRRRGFARALMQHVGLTPAKRFVFTFKTALATELVEHWPHARFDPLMLRRLRRRETKENL